MEPSLLGGLLLPEKPHVAGGPLDQLLRCTGKQNLSVVDHNQLIAHRLHVLNDVGGQQDQPLPGGLGEQVAKVDALLRVQAHGGLVEDQEGRVPQQGLGDAHPLALAAGQGTDLGPCLLLQVDGLNGTLDGGFRLPQPLQGRHVVQKLGDRELVEQPEVLGQIAQPGFQLPLPLGQGLPIHQNGAGGGQQGGHQQLHQGGLARPVRAQQADKAGGAQVQV